jgi:phytoene synthase
MPNNFKLTKEEFDQLKGSLLHDKSTYQIASQIFFSKKVLDAVVVLYAFVRFVDQIVDETKNEEQTKIDIKKERSVFFHLFDNPEKESENLIYKKFVELAIAKKFKKEWIEAFWNSMEEDLYKKTYDTYEELENYMYGSASVVGLMMTNIMGYKKENPKTHAIALAEAMQLTNFLRDVGEDYMKRERIYLPKEFLKKYNIKEEDFIRENYQKKEWVEMMQELSNKARLLFQEGNAGIKYLNKDSRKAVYCASLLYESILDDIEKNDYNVFTKKGSANIFQKTKILWKTIIKKW